MTGQSPEAQKTQIVLKTCILLVSHFRNLHENKGLGFHTRLFSHMLHPEREFVFAGRSVNVNQDTDTHPEHIVPCAVLISECRRMISQGATDEQIAPLLAKHWKIATITVAEKITWISSWVTNQKCPMDGHLKKATHSPAFTQQKLSWGTRHTRPLDPLALCPSHPARLRSISDYRRA